MANRNDQLEAALDNAIAYLQAWPPHPATTAKIRELLEAKRLADKEPNTERSMVGVQYAESGVPRIRAELVGGNLHLWSGLGNNEVWELHRRLCSTEGLRLSMRELALNEPRTSLEIALRQRADGFDVDPPAKPSSQAGSPRVSRRPVGLSQTKAI